MNIRLAKPDDISHFFEYLQAHLSDDSVGDTHLFQSLSSAESNITTLIKSQFYDGIKKGIEQTGWRRLWLAFEDDIVVGHIEIRAHPQAYTQHRVLLGMGVSRDYRQQGLGKQLLNTLITWLSGYPHIEYLDLWVVSSNLAAIGLYSRNDFKAAGEIEDMFRIAGTPLPYTFMFRQLNIE
ncbi:GNAT family N-acetyltransferase [Shewanella surugensis]|uniref:GNAT family N-acetyltransferase n=1 Tax=Shewanella surugensis TaxID=212020 RepID=A0ABT0L7V3_9GAMM|nr:GNAT family N-acetyltransferase [Shewanella surugensis]MCL1123773.1 GNAT family N-acetyltransferase [Shewanella surugensis]